MGGELRPISMLPASNLHSSQNNIFRRKIAENYNGLSTVLENYRRQTDRRQTDGRQQIANVKMT